jgi:DNA gyrase subunit B
MHQIIFINYWRELMTAKKNYSDEDIKSLPYPENVRQRPQIFIGNLDEKGSLTCFREILNNSVDEFLRGKFCTEIKITQHSKNSFTIEDNGRGIPLNSLHKVFGELYTGRNYTKNVDKSFTTGLNGK